MKTFSSTRTCLFSKYSEFDDLIVDSATENGIPLYGGTGLQYWCNYLGIKFYRERSVNDLDFCCDKSNSDGLRNFAKVLTQMRLSLSKLKGSDRIVYRFQSFTVPVSVDIAYKFSIIPGRYKELINNHLVWNPFYMFVTKLARYVETVTDQLYPILKEQFPKLALKDEYDLYTDLLVEKKYKGSISKFKQEFDAYKLQPLVKQFGEKIISNFEKGNFDLTKYELYKS